MVAPECDHPHVQMQSIADKVGELVGIEMALAPSDRIAKHD
jgi:hypothetical protein